MDISVVQIFEMQNKFSRCSNTLNSSSLVQQTCKDPAGSESLTPLYFINTSVSDKTPFKNSYFQNS